MTFPLLQKTSGVPGSDELDLIWGTISKCDSREDEDGETVMLDDDDITFLEEEGVVEASYPRRRYDSLDEVSEHSQTGERCRANNIPTFAEFFGRMTRVSSEDEDFGIMTEGLEASNSPESDLDEKPFTKSRRGAKNVLLWKFLLQMLDDRPDLATWIDQKKGLFKFVDTNALSKMWGEKKQRRDMNFEKLSRGIRHYYKSGLMTRKEGTRLVYQFHWSHVPKEFQK